MFGSDTETSTTPPSRNISGSTCRPARRASRADLSRAVRLPWRRVEDRAGPGHGLPSQLQPDLAPLRQALAGVCCSASSSRSWRSRSAASSGSRWRSLYVSGNRLVRGLIAAYVEVVRNVPLMLLVYLVFYGLPTVVDLAYCGHDLVRRHAVGLCGGLSGRGVPLGARGGAARAARCRPGDRAHARPAPRLCAAADHAAHRAARAVQHLRVAVQGHVGRVGDRRARS